MIKVQHANVAVLLATYNGAQHVESQIRSLKENVTPFTLHWLDDHSSDNSRVAVETAARCAQIELIEWHQAQHQGVPGSYFRLLECVEADIYLFCDQDDIWQPGKIDAAAANLVPALASPVLAFSDFFLLNETEPENSRRLADVVGEGTLKRGVQESRMFMPASVAAHTQAFTRPLRDIFLRHSHIAFEYAFMHDLWMYNIALACGNVFMYRNVPTTLYREHRMSFCGSTFSRLGSNFVSRRWQFQQMWRRVISRHAQGLILASPTLPHGQKIETFLNLARIVATLDRRQSPAALARLARRGVLWPAYSTAAWFAAACLSSDAMRLQPKPLSDQVRSDGARL